MHRKLRSILFGIGNKKRMLTIASTAQNNAEHALRQQQSNKDLKGRNNIVIFE